MPEHREGRNLRSHQHKEQQEQQPLVYHQAARYVDAAASKVSFDHAQQAIYETPGDLATCRLLVMPDNLWYVVVLGDLLPDDLRKRLTESLAIGELVSVPTDLLIALNQHRKALPTRG